MSIDGGVVTDLWFGLDMNFVTYTASSVAIVANFSGITGNGSTGSATVTKGANGTDTLVNINQLVGSNFNDSMTGSTALTWEYFEGGPGNDTINGGVITDIVNFENGNRISYGSAPSAVTVTCDDFSDAFGR